MTHYFYDKLPDMHLLAGSTSDPITSEFDEEVLDDNATMTVYIARAEAPDVLVNNVSCTKYDDSFVFVMPSSKTKDMHGVYNLDFLLSNNSVTTRVARGILVVDMSPKEVSS